MQPPRFGPAIALALVALCCVTDRADGHDIPDARVDRSIQVVLKTSRIEVDYEVSLAELTLVRDLRRLIEVLPAGLDRDGLLRLYGEGTAQLNAKGLIVDVDGASVALQPLRFRVDFEEHPRFTFHFEGRIPEAGRLTLRDTNYTSGDGTSRLALRSEGVRVEGYGGPDQVEDVPIRPIWMLTPAEHKRTVEIRVDYAASANETVTPAASTPRVQGPAESKPREGPRLARLLDRAAAGSRVWLVLSACFLGIAHAFQPGHGKALVAAASLGATPARGAVLAVVTTLAHFSTVLVLVLALWFTGTERYEEINTVILGVAGFAIAANGFWRLGSYFSDQKAAVPIADSETTAIRDGSGILALGLANGLIPCWDAVTLVILAFALGKPALGVLLAGSFCLGQGLVLLSVSLLASQFQIGTMHGGAWRRRLELGSAMVLVAIGLLVLR